MLDTCSMQNFSHLPGEVGVPLVPLGFTLKEFDYPRSCAGFGSDQCQKAKFSESCMTGGRPEQQKDVLWTKCLEQKSHQQIIEPHNTLSCFSESFHIVILTSMNQYPSWFQVGELLESRYLVPCGAGNMGELFLKPQSFDTGRVNNSEKSR